MAVLAMAVVTLLGGRGVAQQCIGDCDGDGQVTVDELMLGVQIGIGSAPLDACPAIDCTTVGGIHVDCLIAAVRHALDGCPTGQCGTAECALGEYCCNPLLSICAPLGSACIQ